MLNETWAPQRSDCTVSELIAVATIWRWWNLGKYSRHRSSEAMIDYIADLDAYDHNIIVHTYPEWQDRVYKPLLGNQSKLTGTSLQNSSLATTHADGQMGECFLGHRIGRGLWHLTSPVALMLNVPISVTTALMAEIARATMLTMNTRCESKRYGVT